MFTHSVISIDWRLCLVNYRLRQINCRLCFTNCRLQSLVSPSGLLLAVPPPNCHLRNLNCCLRRLRLRLVSCWLCHHQTVISATLTVISTVQRLRLLFGCLPPIQLSSSQFSIFAYFPIDCAAKPNYRLCLFLCCLRRLASPPGELSSLPGEFSSPSVIVAYLHHHHFCFSISVPAIFFKKKKKKYKSNFNFWWFQRVEVFLSIFTLRKKNKKI